MQITFGIITDGSQSERVGKVIQSIWDQQIPCNDYEIIVVGGNYVYGSYDGKDKGMLHLESFDETVKPGWITKKKNLITKKAQFDVVVYMHDYISLAPDWYKGFLAFGNAWDICMNKLHNPDGTRYRDWVAWDDARHGGWWYQREPWCGPEGRFTMGTPCIVPYNYIRTWNMYISGAYWVAKRRVMIEQPLDEKLVWSQAEDVEWSLRVRRKYRYAMNTNSTCILLKQKDPIFPFVNLI